MLMGGIGIVIPILPTTPFILLAAILLSGNKGIYHWLSRRSCFRGYIANYNDGTGLTNKTVAVSLVFLWTMLLLSGIIMNRSWLYLLLFIIGTGITFHILWIRKPKTKKGAEPERSDME